MKIAYVTTAIIPGMKAHSVQIVQLCEALAACGNTVTLYTPYRGSSKEEVYAQYGVETPFPIRFIWVPHIPWVPRSFSYALELAWFVTRIRLMRIKYDRMLTRD